MKHCKKTPKQTNKQTKHTLQSLGFISSYIRAYMAILSVGSDTYRSGGYCSGFLRLNGRYTCVSVKQGCGCSKRNAYYNGLNGPITSGILGPAVDIIFGGEHKNGLVASWNEQKDLKKVKVYFKVSWKEKESQACIMLYLIISDLIHICLNWQKRHLKTGRAFH